MGNPTVTPFTENRHDGGYIVWEPSNGIVTREEILLAADADAAFLQAGTVLGKVTATGQYAIHDPAAADGTETAAAILFGGRQLKAGATVKAVANVRGPMRVNGGELIWIDGIAANDKADAITALEGLAGGGIQVTV